MADLIKGIDISVIQGAVNFAAVVATGVKFVICRCGVGNGGIDKNYAINIANAKAVGLKVMAYHFIYPLPTIPSQPMRDPTQQAQYHAHAAQGELAACDLEWPVPEDWAKWGCHASQIVDWTTTYLQAYESITGIRPVVYTYPYFAHSIKLPDSFGQTYKLWIASYTNTPAIPKPWTDWVLWQNSGGTQKLPNGVPVDTDYAKDLSLWDALPAPVVVAPPVIVPDPPPVPNPPTPTPAPVPIPAPVPVPDPNQFGLFSFSSVFKTIMAWFEKL